MNCNLLVAALKPRLAATLPCCVGHRRSPQAGESGTLTPTRVPTSPAATPALLDPTTRAADAPGSGGGDGGGGDDGGGGRFSARVRQATCWRGYA